MDRLTQPVPDRDAEFGPLEECVAEALREARRLGADGAFVSASSSQGLDVTVRLGEVETIEHTRDRGVGITVYLGRSKGSASSGDLRPETIRESVRRALDIARHTQEDRCNGLPDEARLATAFPDLDLWHPRALDVAEATERALACEAAGRSDERIGNSEGATVSASAGVSVIGNSLGFVGRSSGTRYGQNCVLVAADDNGMQRDYAWDSRRRFEDLETPEHTGRLAARRTVERLGARKLATLRAPVLFAPEVARGLLGHLVQAVSGGQLYRNASFLKDAAGQRLFPAWVRIEEEPFLPRGAGSRAFDSEGVATRPRRLVDEGVLTGYVLGSYSARRLGLESTGNAGGVSNLLARPGGEGAGDLVAGLDRGLLVTEVMGQGVRLLTGDYSRGASGFWVENGRIVHPVEEVTVAGNLRDMFANVVAIGEDVDTRSNLRCGSVLIADMTIAGT